MRSVLVFLSTLLLLVVSLPSLSAQVAQIFPNVTGTISVSVTNKVSGDPFFGVGFPMEFTINGLHAPIMTLYIGVQYNFSISTTSIHPWYIGTDPTGEDQGFLYAGQTTGTFSWTPSTSDAAQPALYYECQNHPNMGNSIFLVPATSPSSPAVSSSATPAVASSTALPSTAPAAAATSVPSPIPSIDPTVTSLSVVTAAKQPGDEFFNVGFPALFVVNGMRAPIITVYRGVQYNFSLNTGSIHPWYIGTSSVGEGQGHLYSGQSTGTFSWTPSASDQAQPAVYYECENHANLGNQIFIIDPPAVSSSAAPAAAVSSSAAPVVGASSSAATSAPVASIPSSAAASSSPASVVSSSAAPAAIVSSSAATSAAVASVSSSAATTSASSASLCVLLYSLPGGVDYPFSLAYSLQVSYLPNPVASAAGPSVTLLTATGTRTFTNRFGAQSVTAITLSSPASLALNSSSPITAVGLNFTAAPAIQSPGGDPLSLVSTLRLSSVGGALTGDGALLDPLGQAVLASIPGFNNLTLGASNVNALAALYSTCQAPIAFTNGLRAPTQPSASNGGLKPKYSYSLSDGLTYSVQVNLTLTTSSAFATTADALGNPYQTIVNATGTRVYTHLPTGQMLTSVVGLASAVGRPVSQRLYPYSLLASAPGVYSQSTAPFLDFDGLGLSVTPPVPANGQPVTSTATFGVLAVYTAVNRVAGSASLAEYLPGSAAPLKALQAQTYTIA